MRNDESPLGHLIKDYPDWRQPSSLAASTCSAAEWDDAMDLSLELYAIAQGFEFDEEEMIRKFHNIPSVHHTIRQMAFRLTSRQNPPASN